jgi:hypothetical protein
MGLKNIDLINCIKEKTFRCSKNNTYKFNVNFLSFTFGYKDDVYFHATLIDQDSYEYRVIIKAIDNTEKLLDKIVFIKSEDQILFNTFKVTCADYVLKNESLTWD